MAPVTVPFSGFAFGEYGSQSPFGVGFAVFRQHLLYRGWWTGQNMVRTFDGTLIPCPQPKQQTVTGLPATASPGNLGFGYKSVSPGNWADRVLYFKEGTALYQAAANSYAFSAGTGTLASGSWFDSVAIGSATYIAGNGVTKIDHTTAAVTAIAGSPNGNVIASFGDRLYVAGPSSGAGFGNRVYFSAPGDFTSWPAANYFDVGSGNVPIVALIPMRHMLAIAKASGPDTTWWAMTGVPGFNNVLRRVAISTTPPYPYAAAPLADGSTGLYTGGQQGAKLGMPGLFNGAASAQIRYLGGLLDDTGTGEVYRLREPGDWMVVDSGGLLLHREGAWSYQNWLSLNFRAGLGFRGVAADPVQDTYVFHALSGSSPYTINLYEWKAYHERPAFTADTQGAIPAAASCFFSLPEWWTRSGEEVAVDAVWVDFIAWNTGDSNPNTFTVNAVAMRTYDPESQGGSTGTAGGDLNNATPVTFSEATSKATTSGSRRRMTANFDGRTWGNGFRLDFTNLRGVSIQKVVVEANVRPSQGT